MDSGLKARADWPERTLFIPSRSWRSPGIGSDHQNSDLHRMDGPNSCHPTESLLELAARWCNPRGKGNRIRTPAGNESSLRNPSSMAIWQQRAGKFTPAAIAMAVVPQSLPLTSIKYDCPLRWSIRNSIFAGPCHPKASSSSTDFSKKEGLEIVSDKIPLPFWSGHDNNRRLAMLRTT